MPKQLLIGDKEIKRILILKKQGLSFAQIAQKLFVGRRTIFRALKRRNIKVANRPVLDQRQIDRILVLKSQGLTDSLIAKRIGTSRRIISDVVNGRYKPIHIENGYDSPLDQCE